jgi:hypothetical protein
LIQGRSRSSNWSSTKNTRSPCIQICATLGGQPRSFYQGRRVQGLIHRNIGGTGALYHLG